MNNDYQQALAGYERLQRLYPDLDLRLKVMQGYGYVVVEIDADNLERIFTPEPEKPFLKVI